MKIARVVSAASLIALFLAAASLASPALAAGWKTGDDVYAFDISFTSTSGARDTALTGTWLHYSADNHRLGMALLYLNNDATDGSGLGPSYEFLFPALKKGRLFVGGDATALGGDLDQAGAVAAAFRFGYELYVGDTAALRVQAHQFQVVNPSDDELADEMGNYGLTFGILLGAPSGVAVN